MSITYQCEHCGRWYTVRESKVGTLARCKDCDHEMVVPNTPDLFDDAIDGPPGGAAIPASRRPSATAWATSTRPAPSVRPGSRADEPSGKLWGGGLGVIGVILLVVLRVIAHGGLQRPQRPPRPIRPPALAGQAPRVPVGNLDAPVEMPVQFPELGRPVIRDGIATYEITLFPRKVPPPPGHSGRLWLYLPETKGPPAPGSLPCVLIAPAGGIGVTGMKLAEGDPTDGDPGDRPEHAPYVRAGFAVLAFELDGADPARGRLGPPLKSMLAFLRARAGLVNGRIAKEFLKRRVPEVDQDRLYVAGHSSAATFALLFAEHDRDIKGCVAYAPAIDLRARLGVASGQVRALGFEELMTRCSPTADESRLGCPVFLFHSREDETIPFDSTVEFAERLQALKKTVTLKVVDDNDRDHHYDPMIKQGIPAGIAWLKARDAEVRAGKK